MKNKIIILALLVILIFTAQGSTTIQIWPESNPDSWHQKLNETQSIRNGVKRLHNIGTPTITHFAPKQAANGKAILICPGGGYNVLAIDKEGTEVATWLSDNGFHAFVLKYRLPRKGLDKIKYAPALQDCQRAMKIIRQQSQKLGLRKVGVMGFSAGGHLSATLSSNQLPLSYTPIDNIDKISHLPDFLALIYPAYLVKNKTQMTLNQEVTPSPKTPSTFLVQTSDDPIPVENSIAYYLQLKKRRISAELHIYPRGPHGYGIRDKRTEKKAVNQWPELFLKWLKKN